MNGSYTPTYWSGLDTVMLMSDSTGYGLNAVTEASMEREINVMYRGFAYIGVLVSFAMDIHHAFTDPNLTTAQRTATISLAIGTAIFAGLAVYLSAGLLGIVLSLFITILLNIIKVIIMQSIINSQRERKIRFA
ncbi:MAG: hypothetical protein A2010_03460 [Nitrospirae bacterium GWD2_57_9]|nr:MAG: hypothetical protein A2010_03460 [Nitrospirae bacterium GWD2_57_9]